MQPVGAQLKSRAIPVFFFTGIHDPLTATAYLPRHSPKNTLRTTTATFPLSPATTFFSPSPPFDEQRRQMLLLLSGCTEAAGDLRYAPDKWSLKEVLGHINDTERVIRLPRLAIPRVAMQPRSPASTRMTTYVMAPSRARPLADLIEDYIAVRRATLSLFRNLDEPPGPAAASPTRTK